MSKNKRNELLKQFPFLFEEQICPICNKKFFIHYDLIKRKANILKNNKNYKLIIACCTSHRTILQMKILGSALSDKELHKTIVKTKKNNIDKDGLNGLQRVARKAIQTKRKDIDENGLDGIQRGTNKAMISAKTRIDENGNNAYQRASIKGLNTKRKDIDENGLDGIQRGTLHAVQTVQKRYNVDCYFQTEEYKNYMKQPEVQKRTQQKVYNTKKKNGTFNISNPENIVYQALVYKFDFEDIIPQYKDKERYNFACDFYIKSLDLFIEINFYWTHGYEPFNYNNIEHLKLLKHWIEESNNINFKNEKKKQYKKAMYIWTIVDPKKFQIAKQNNLNYLAFYNWEQFFEWYCALP